MSEEKKYSEREAALAVLKKTEEILKKSEMLKKYASENSSKLGYKLSEEGKNEKQPEKSDKAFEVKGKNSKSSDDARLANQVSPAKNPKEKAEGNNAKWGLKPKELGKGEMKKDGAPGPTVGSIINYPGADKTAPMGKGEESKHDRCVEHVKENSPEVKNPHAVCVAEGVKPAKWGKEEAEQAFIPVKSVGSAKLSKFMEHKHAKRKAGQGA